MNKKSIQLFLIPFAGGSALSYKKLIECLDYSIEAIPIEYAGRGTRRKEDYILDYETFLEDVAVNIKDKRNQSLPFAVLGYSMGSAITYDLIMQKKIDEEPSLLIFCAREFLKLKSISQGYINLSDDEFIKKIHSLGGLDERILKSERFLNIYLEPLKADYRIWSQFKYKEFTEKLSCDIQVFYSEKDTPKENVIGWQCITNGLTEFYEYGNNHFFINGFYRQMAGQINEKILELFKFDDK